MEKTVLTSLLAFSLITPLSAEILQKPTEKPNNMVVIDTVGQTKPIDEVIGKHVSIGRAMAIAKSKAAKTIEVSYPFKTPSLTPGRVIRKKADFFWLKIPFFIVGTDNVSAQWIQENYASLKKNNAVGIIVNANSEFAVNKLKSLSEGLQLFVAPGDSLAKELGIRHYPAVVSQYGVEQ